MDIVTDSTIFMYDDTPLSYIYTMESFYFNICEEFIKTDHQYLKCHDVSILTESTLDLLHRMVSWFKSLIDKFLTGLKNINARLSTNILKLDEYCRLYKDKLSKIHVSFDIKGFNYTIYDNINFKPFDDIISDYNKTIANIKLLSKDEVMRRQESTMAESSMNKLRASIINNKESIPSSDYIEVIRRKYRDGQIEAKDMHIDNGVVDQIVKNSAEITRNLKLAKKEQQQVEKFVKETEILFDRKIPIVFKDGRRQMELKSAKNHNGQYIGTTEAMSDRERDKWESRIANAETDKQRADLKLRYKEALDKEHSVSRYEQSERAKLKSGKMDADSRDLDKKKSRDYESMRDSRRREKNESESLNQNKSKPIQKIDHTIKSNNSNSSNNKDKYTDDYYSPKSKNNKHPIGERHVDYNDQLYEVVTLYTRYIFNYTKTVSMLYTTAVSERMHALDEQSKFYMTILKRVTGMNPDDGGNAYSDKNKDDATESYVIRG